MAQEALLVRLSIRLQTSPNVHRPKQFPKNTYDEDDDESNVGKMPPSDSEDET